MIKKPVIAILSAILLLVGGGASAGIVINTTRVILHQDKKEALARLDNKGTVPLLVQSWIDDGDANANLSTIRVPFSVTPPVARVDPGKGQAIRILAVNPNLPSDRESLFWFNVMEIPPAPAASMAERQNFIQVAVRTRIKLFYRPASLAISPSVAYEGLSFALKRADGGAAASDSIVVRNPSPYFITFNYLALQLSDRENVEISLSNPESRMVAPFAEMTINIPALKKALPSDTRVSFATVNDTGGTTRLETALAQ